MRRRSIDLTTTHLAAMCKKKKKKEELTHWSISICSLMMDGYKPTAVGIQPSLTPPNE